MLILFSIVRSGSLIMIPQVPVFEKELFSMCTPEVMAHLNALPNKPTDVVLFGIEAHVCVTQVSGAIVLYR